MSSNSRVGLVGCGAWGKNLARNLHASGALAALCDHSQKALQQQSALYPQARCYSEGLEMIDHGAIDALAIGSSASTHFNLIQAAFDAGLDVYCEKPLTLDIAEAEAVVARARDEQRILMVGHLLQYHPVFRHLLALVHDGALGALRYIAAHRVNLGAFRYEESALWCLSPHDVSMILALVGDQLPERVLALGGDYLTPGVQDMVHSHLRFANGVRAHCYASWLNPYKEQRLTVIGETATAVFDDGQAWPEKLRLYHGQVQLDSKGQPKPNQVPGEPVAVPQGEPLRDEIEHFLDCCQSRQAPRTSGEEGIRVMRVTAAAQASVSTDAAWQYLH
jgi:UDP-2-acetamido-3-amino-2,3-dideoxy-glucuronate N-acetyltransferase